MHIHTEKITVLENPAQDIMGFSTCRMISLLIYKGMKCEMSVIFHMDSSEGDCIDYSIDCFVQ